MTAVVVNPLVADIPPLPCFLAQGCNKFNAENAEVQFKQLSDLCHKHLVPVLGPMCGFACGT